MPLSRYLTLIALVLATAGATVLAGAALAPGLPEAAGPWAGVALMLAALLALHAGRRR